jgi:hypothetical protein
MNTSSNLIINPKGRAYTKQGVLRDKFSKQRQWAKLGKGFDKEPGLSHNSVSA